MVIISTNSKHLENDIVYNNQLKLINLYLTILSTKQSTKDCHSLMDSEKKTYQKEAKRTTLYCDMMDKTYNFTICDN